MNVASWVKKEDNKDRWKKNWSNQKWSLHLWKSKAIVYKQFVMFSLMNILESYKQYFKMQNESASFKSMVLWNFCFHDFK